MARVMIDPHSGPAGHLSPDRRGRRSAAATPVRLRARLLFQVDQATGDVAAMPAQIQPGFLSPVDRERGAERSEAEWGSTGLRDRAALSIQDEPTWA